MPSERDKPPFIAGVRDAAIPRVVHQIWLQGAERPQEPLLSYMDGVRAACERGDWRYLLWCEADVRLLPSECRSLWDVYRPGCCHLSQVSNLLRYLILWELGGLYLDADIEVFTLPEELSGAWIAGKHGVGARDAGVVNVCAMAAEPHHPYLGRIVDRFPGIDWGEHLSAGSALGLAALDRDVSRWPREAWHGHPRNPRSYGYHHSLGKTCESFTPFAK